MPFRAVASDLDGTLLRSDGTLDERSRRALAAVEGQGVMVVICTARPARWMRPLAEATGHRGVAICANGISSIRLAAVKIATSPVPPWPLWQAFTIADSIG